MKQTLIEQEIEIDNAAVDNGAGNRSWLCNFKTPNEHEILIDYAVRDNGARKQVLVMKFKDTDGKEI